MLFSAIPGLGALIAQPVSGVLAPSAPPAASADAAPPVPTTAPPGASTPSKPTRSSVLSAGTPSGSGTASARTSGGGRASMVAETPPAESASSRLNGAAAAEQHVPVSVSLFSEDTSNHAQLTRRMAFLMPGMQVRSAARAGGLYMALQLRTAAACAAPATPRAVSPRCPCNPFRQISAL